MPHCMLGVVLFLKSTEIYPPWGFLAAGVHESSSVKAPAQCDINCRPSPPFFELSEAGSKTCVGAQTDRLFRKDCTSGISGISTVAGCSIYTLVMSGQMGHAAPADCWAGCHWESHRHTWDSPVCINNTRKAEQEPGNVHRHCSCGAGRDEQGLALLWC